MKHSVQQGSAVADIFDGYAYVYDDRGDIYHVPTLTEIGHTFDSNRARKIALRDFARRANTTTKPGGLKRGRYNIAGGNA